MNKECCQLECIYHILGTCISEEECDGSKPVLQVQEETSPEINYLIGTEFEKEFNLDDEFKGFNF